MFFFPFFSFFCFSISTTLHLLPQINVHRPSLFYKVFTLKICHSAREVWVGAYSRMTNAKAALCSSVPLTAMSDSPRIS